MSVSEQHQTSGALVVASPQAMELEKFRTLGRWLSLAELDANTPESKGAAAALRFALAAELGVNPTAALTELSFIHGRLNLSAQLVRALALKAGYKVKRLELDDQHCVAQLVNIANGEVEGETEYTIEDARRAGLIREKSNWMTTPKRMLWARASKRVVDDFAPEVSLGITTPEEEAEISSEAWEDYTGGSGPLPTTGVDGSPAGGDDGGPIATDLSDTPPAAALPEAELPADPMPWDDPLREPEPGDDTGGEAGGLV